MMKIMNERRNGRKTIREIMGQRMNQQQSGSMFAIFYDLTRYLHDDVTAAAADVYIHYLDHPTN